MQIQFQRTGGIAGITQRYSVSPESLPDDDRRKLMELIANAHFFDQPAELRKAGPGADKFQYKISIESDQGSHEIRVDQGAAPAELQPLIAWLQAAARKR